MHTFAGSLPHERERGLNDGLGVADRVLMGDAVYSALDWFRSFVDATASWHVAFWLLLPWILETMGTLVHELGHAVVARRHGVKLREVVVAPEGLALAFRRNGLAVRVGLGLGRDLRSRAPLGWVRVDSWDLTAEQAIEILRAGPIAEAGLGVVELCVAAAPLPWLGRILLLLTALSTIAGAHRNLYDERRPGSDGAQIHRIRQQALGPQQPQPRAGDDDPCVTTSVPPPGY